MPVSQVWAQGPAVIAGTSGTQLNGIDDKTINPGLVDIMRAGVGQVDPTYVATMTRDSIIPMTVTEIAKVLALTGIDGMCFPDAALITTVDHFFTEQDECATRKTGLEHFRTRVSKGIMIPLTLTVTQGDVATLATETHGVFDGTNDIFEYNDDLALPAIPDVDELFTLGKAVLNGVQLDALTGYTIEFGITLSKKGADGDVDHTWVSIKTRQPKITFKTNRVLTLSDFGIDGTPVTSAVFYLRKLLEGAARVPDATPEHIRFDVTEGKITTANMGGSDGEDMEGDVIVQPIFDGTNDIIQINTASAIT